MARVGQLLNISYKLFCICCCIYQLQNVVLSFFEYDTVTQNRFLSPKMIQFPSTHVCFIVVYDGIDRLYLKRKYGIDSTEFSDIADTLTDNLTVEEILEHSTTFGNRYL